MDGDTETNKEHVVKVVEATPTTEQKQVEPPPNRYDPTLEEIDLTNARLTTMDDFSHCHALTRLILRQNTITSIHPSLRTMSQLTELDLYENKLTTIAKGELPQHLTWLDLSFNEQRHIPELENLHELRDLFLVNNKLRSINTALLPLTSLVQLELGSNRLRVIENLHTLVNLEELWLGRNKITQIQGLENLVKLRKLSLQSNRITTITGLSTLTRLEELQLSHNGISRIEGLETLTRLRILDLGANQITHIEGIHNQKGLVELWLNENQISSFDELSAIASPLETIYLEHNPIASDPSYQQRILAAIPTLTQLDANELESGGGGGG